MCICIRVYIYIHTYVYVCIYIVHIGCFVAFQFLEKAANVAKRVKHPAIQPELPVLSHDYSDFG